MRITLLLLYFFILNFPVFSQQTDSLSKFKKNIHNIYEAAKGTIKWYDIPILLGVYYQNKYISAMNYKKPITLTPLNFESEINEKVGINGRVSLGSIDKELFPTTLILSRISIIMVGHYLLNYKSTIEDFKHPFVLFKTLLYTDAITELTKNLVYKERPDKSDSRSFISGHSSTNFAASAFFYKEIDDFLDKWGATKDNNTLRFSLKAVSFTSLYGWSSYVAYSRIRDNKHYLVDVLAGAAVGIIFANFMYDQYLDNELTENSHISINFLNGTPTIGYYINFP
jgi:membrane-associated phospholipid phosphatase